MSLVLICLAVMGVLMFLSVISGNSFIGSSIDVGVDTGAIVNGTTTEFLIDDVTAVFSIDLVQGVIVWFVVITAIVVVVGFQVVATGLSDTSVRTLRTTVMYGGVWVVLSVIVYDLIVSIEIFGSLIYVGLTLMYVIGVFQQMGENG